MKCVAVVPPCAVTKKDTQRKAAEEWCPDPRSMIERVSAVTRPRACTLLHEQVEVAVRAGRRGKRVLARTWTTEAVASAQGVEEGRAGRETVTEAHSPEEVHVRVLSDDLSLGSGANEPLHPSVSHIECDRRRRVSQLVEVTASSLRAHQNTCMHDRGRGVLITNTWPTRAHMHACMQRH
jgi:hypothetical protein